LQRNVRIFLKRVLFSITPKLGRQTKNSCPENLVLVHLENLGDFLIFSAVIRETRRNFPFSNLIVVAQKENSAVVKNCHLVDEWIWIKGHKKPKLGESTGQEVTYGKKLISVYLCLFLKYRKKIDLLIGPDWLLVKNVNQFTNNLIFRKANVVGGYLDKFMTVRTELFMDQSHQVLRSLSVLQMLGLTISSDRIENWVFKTSELDTIRKSGNINKACLDIVISLGAGHPQRNFPLLKLAQVIDNLNSRVSKLRFTILGPKSLNIEDVNSTLMGARKTRNLVGKTDLKQASELILSSDLVIANDSGFAHLAASFRIPILVTSAHALDAEIWHLHSPKRYHPWTDKYIVLQPPKLLDSCNGSCDSNVPHCIDTITVEDVVESVVSLLELEEGFG
jgi:ADP-heptose:LPS heptosyltransferase